MNAYFHVRCPSHMFRRSIAIIRDVVDKGIQIQQIRQILLYLYRTDMIMFYFADWWITYCLFCNTIYIFGC